MLHPFLWDWQGCLEGDIDGDIMVVYLVWNVIMGETLSGSTCSAKSPDVSMNVKGLSKRSGWEKGTKCLY